MTNRPKTSNPPDGFSILELLVAIAVLTILVVLVAQMLGSASSVTSGSRKRMAADEEARMVFDRMSADIARMVKRDDVDSLFLSKAGNDEMYFYSEAPAIYANAASNSPVALVGYRVESNSLVRVSEGKNWDDITFLTVGTNGTTNAASRISTNSAVAQVIGPSVFRMEYTFLMKPGTTNVSGGTNSANTYSQTNVAGMGFKDVSAVVVSLAVLDESSRKIVDTNALGTIAGNMSDATTGPSSTNWSATVTSLPGPARAATRIYQRYIPVTQ
ncbi:MAG: prepilin-type N-terminal cleavage/methylation domain-containing protein [Verrucomicrobiota bacterium]